MGMHQYTYTGPFLLVKNPEEEVTDTIQACVNPDCPRYGKRATGSFCTECGGPIQDFEIKVKQRQFCNWDISQAIDEMLMMPMEFGDQLMQPWLPNCYGDWPTDRKTRTFSNESGQEVHPVSNQCIQNEIKWFEEHFAEAIAHLKETCGEDGVEVIWGIVSYWM